MYNYFGYPFNFNNSNSMGYNNAGQYNNFMAQQNQQSMQQSSQQTPIFTFVNGIEGAKAYIVPAGMTAILRDSDNANIFYTKIADMQGQATMKAYKYEEITSTTPKAEQIDLSNFVKREEFEELKKLVKGGK